jgi:hypothetical protein
VIIQNLTIGIDEVNVMDLRVFAKIQFEDFEGLGDGASNEGQNRSDTF